MRCNYCGDTLMLNTSLVAECPTCGDGAMAELAESEKTLADTKGFLKLENPWGNNPWGETYKEDF